MSSWSSKYFAIAQCNDVLPQPCREKNDPKYHKKTTLINEKT